MIEEGSICCGRKNLASASSFKYLCIISQIAGSAFLMTPEDYSSKMAIRV
jgi:hypothetical protein